MYAVCVTFRVAANRIAEFLPAIQANASASLWAEPGCHRFDVLTDAGKPDQVFLYELYTDRAAFDAHCASPHFLSFDTATRDMILEKTVAMWDHVVS